MNALKAFVRAIVPTKTFLVSLIAIVVFTTVASGILLGLTVALYAAFVYVYTFLFGATGAEIAATITLLAMFVISVVGPDVYSRYKRIKREYENGV